jgi:hypothetical protein
LNQSYAASANLGTLPLDACSLNETESFLGSITEMANYVIWRITRENDMLNDSEIDCVKRLYQQSVHLSDQMDELSNNLVNQDLRILDVQRCLWEENGIGNVIVDELGLMETGLDQYPKTDISKDLLAAVDAPAVVSALSAPTQAQVSAPAAQGQDKLNDIVQINAIKKAMEFWLGQATDGYRGVVSYESAGDIPAYSIEISTEGAGSSVPIAQVDVVKEDGFVLWAIAIPTADQGQQQVPQQAPQPAPQQVPQQAPQPAPQPAHAPDASLADGSYVAHDFLRHRELPVATLAHSRRTGDSAIYVFIPVADGIRDYTRQLIMQVHLADMRVIGFEGSAFYRNRTREHFADKEQIVVTVELLSSFLSPYLQMDTINLAFIQNDWGKGILTWEVDARVEREHFLLYYNVTNGAEEKIQRIR